MCNDYNTGRENVKCYVAKTLHMNNGRFFLKLEK